MTTWQAPLLPRIPMAGRRFGLALLLLAAPGAAKAAGSDGRLYFPPIVGEWETISASEAGWDPEALAEALAFARDNRSSDVVLLHEGRLLAERTWRPEAGPRYSRMVVGRTADDRPIEDVASVQKSVLSFLAGVARGRGLLDFEAPVSRYLGAGWSKAKTEEEARITVRHLMSMATGLSTQFEWVAPAGSQWAYNTRVYSRLGQILEEVSGLSMSEYTARWLTEPIGMSSSRWVPREWLDGEQDANAVGFATTARDLARFGLLILAQGQWDSRDILGDSRYLGEAMSPSQADNPSYGLLWWLNGQASSKSAQGDRVEGSRVPTAPDDLWSGLGALGRKLYIVPSGSLVVTRLGDAPGSDFDERFWELLSRAAPSPTSSSGD